MMRGQRVMESRRAATRRAACRHTVVEGLWVDYRAGRGLQRLGYEEHGREGEHRSPAHVAAGAAAASTWGEGQGARVRATGGSKSVEKDSAGTDKRQHSRRMNAYLTRTNCSTPPDEEHARLLAGAQRVETARVLEDSAFGRALVSV